VRVGRLSFTKNRCFFLTLVPPLSFYAELASLASLFGISFFFGGCFGLLIIDMFHSFAGFAFRLESISIFLSPSHLPNYDLFSPQPSALLSSFLLFSPFFSSFFTISK